MIDNRKLITLPIIKSNARKKKWISFWITFLFCLIFVVLDFLEELALLLILILIAMPVIIALMPNMVKAEIIGNLTITNNLISIHYKHDTMLKIPLNRIQEILIKYNGYKGESFLLDFIKVRAKDGNSNLMILSYQGKVIQIEFHISDSFQLKKINNILSQWKDNSINCRCFSEWGKLDYFLSNDASFILKEKLII